MEETKIPPLPDEAGELEKKGVDELINALHNNTDPKVRRYAAYLLGKAKNPRAIRPLAEALADFDKSVREQVMLALVETGKAATDSLEAEMNDPKWQARYRAAEALGKIADEKAIKPLVMGLKDNRDHVRYMAAKGLKTIGDSEAIDPLICLLKDNNRFVRLMTVRALTALGGDKVNAALKEAGVSETDDEIRNAIAEALK
ncbi:MAG: HEAT repeat domain-containing protein [Methanoregula sp.]|nr:HEAT repeat domain-containing protein [Methanoregula sp.]